MSVKSVSIGIVSAAVMAIAMCGTAHAGLIGTSVSGDMDYLGTNLFDPANGFVPDGYENGIGTTVPISAATEFGMDTGPLFVTADFTDTGFTLTEIGRAGSGAGFTFSFTDKAFFGMSLKEISNNFQFTAVSLTGDVLTIDQAEFVLENGVPNVLSYAFVSDVPEPTSLVMFGTGVLALGFFGWRRRNRGAI